MALTRDELVARLIRAGELEVSGKDQAETDSYFDILPTVRRMGIPNLAIGSF